VPGVASVTLWAKLVGARENVPSPVPPEELTEVFSADGAKVSETPLRFTEKLALICALAPSPGAVVVAIRSFGNREAQGQRHRSGGGEAEVEPSAGAGRRRGGSEVGQPPFCGSAAPAAALR